MLFLSVSRNSFWRLAEIVVVESTHVLTECNEFIIGDVVDKSYKWNEQPRIPRGEANKYNLSTTLPIIRVYLVH